MQTIRRPLFKSLLQTLLLLPILYAAAAFLILKNEWGSKIFFVISLMIALIIGAVVSIWGRKNEIKIIAILPLVLFYIVLMIVFRSMDYKAFLIIAAILIEHLAITGIWKFSSSTKKRNMKQIRRNYEKRLKK
ncbi:MAG: hypothetical protein IJJ41_01185 [Clostridia bacterium]|nr:hypothetical protein [Clostridia bacterium]